MGHQARSQGPLSSSLSLSLPREREGERGSWGEPAERKVESNLVPRLPVVKRTRVFTIYLKKTVGIEGTNVFNQLRGRGGAYHLQF